MASYCTAQFINSRSYFWQQNQKSFQLRITAVTICDSVHVAQCKCSKFLFLYLHGPPVVRTEQFGRPCTKQQHRTLGTTIVLLNEAGSFCCVYLRVTHVQIRVFFNGRYHSCEAESRWHCFRALRCSLHKKIFH